MFMRAFQKSRFKDPHRPRHPNETKMKKNVIINYKKYLHIHSLRKAQVPQEFVKERIHVKYYITLTNKNNGPLTVLS